MKDTDYFEDREILNDLLLSKKQLSNSYNNSINESTGGAFGRILENMLNETHNMRIDVLEAMINGDGSKAKKPAARI